VTDIESWNRFFGESLRDKTITNRAARQERGFKWYIAPDVDGFERKAAVFANAAAAAPPRPSTNPDAKSDVPRRCAAGAGSKFEVAVPLLLAPTSAGFMAGVVEYGDDDDAGEESAAKR
jgi:hypothetical protein